jgi:hypothetical protein
MDLSRLWSWRSINRQIMVKLSKHYYSRI